MNWLSGINSACLVLSVAMDVGQARQVPKHLMCDCTAFNGRYLLNRLSLSRAYHYKSVWLLVQALTTFGVCLTFVLNGIDPVVFIALLLWGPFLAVEVWRWWVHTKNKRKKLKDKVLGVVREHQGRLKVVPVPVATFALLGALVGCGASSEPESPEPVKTESQTDNWSYVLVPTEDGMVVPCVFYDPAHANAGPAISCDFSRMYKR